MKRAPKEVKNSLWPNFRKTWPLTWRPCTCCGMMVRWEWGYNLTKPTNEYGPRYLYEFVCSNCAPTRVAALEHFGLDLTRFK